MLVKKEKIRICITGSDGFVGKNLIDLLSNDKTIESIPFIGDLLDKDQVKSFFDRNGKFHHVVHLAGVFFGDSKKLIDINITALLHLLEEMQSRDISKIIFTSSGAVYGEPLANISKEDDQLNPNTFYGFTKKIAEELINYYHSNSGLEYVILRFPNVYGDGNDKGVIFNFLESIKKNKEIVVFGDGDQSRNFLHVTDACEAIYKSILFDHNSEIFNISTPEKISVNDLIKRLKAKYDFKVTHQPANNNLKDLLLDSSKARNVLKFVPKVKELKI